MIDRKEMLIASLLMVCIGATNLSANQSLQPVHFQTIKVDGFWQAQFKRLTENGLVRGNPKVMVKPQAEEGAMAGGIFDLRIDRPRQSSAEAKSRAEIRIENDKPTTALTTPSGDLKISRGE